MSVWVSSGYSEFLPQSKHMKVRRIGVCECMVCVPCDGLATGLGCIPANRKRDLTRSQQAVTETAHTAGSY